MEDAAMSQAPVNSYDEWSPLEEVIVGTPYHLDYHADETFRLFFYENIKEEIAYAHPHASVFRAKPNDRLKDECAEDLNGLIKTLEAANITVRQPQTLTEVPVVQTPWWSAPMGHAMMPRDEFLIVGDEIIETAPLVRARYFEGDLFKELFTEYFKAGAKWTVVPKSRLMDRNLDYSYVIKCGYDGPVPEDPFYEIMFDGAQCMRFGKDILFNASTENHRLGAQWLARHLGDEFNVHVVTVTDNHVDSNILPLRAGTLLIREELDIEQLPEGLRKWDMIRYKRFDKPVEVMDEGIPKLASQTIGINVLSLDGDHILVQDIQEPLIRDLEKAGFTPVPLRWRHGRSLGGGFHCVTLDIRRRGGLESYL
jgi:glycine amidinotransferase